MERGKRKAEVVFPKEFRNMRVLVGERAGMRKLDAVPRLGP